MKAFAKLDPPTKKQKGITAEFLCDLIEQSKGNNETTQQAADLIAGGFFFAMRGGEFAKTRMPLQTTRICLKDVTFRDEMRRIIPHDSNRLTEQAIRVTICFRNQKNGEKDEKRSQKRIEHALCPVKVWIRIVRRVRKRVWNASPDTPVCTTTATTTGSRMEITLEAITDLMKGFCDKMKQTKNYGFEAHELGARSIRTGAAMALFMQSKDPIEVQILGRWKSQAFMEYIRPQVLELSDDLAAAMVAFNPITDLANELGLTTPKTKKNEKQFKLFSLN